MYVRNVGDLKGFGYLFQNLQGLFIPNARKGIHPTAVGLFKTSLKNVWYVKFIGNGNYLFRNAEGHFLPFNGTGAAQKEKIVAFRMLQLGYTF